MRVLATHSIRQFPLHFPSRASPCATRFRTSSTALYLVLKYCVRGPMIVVNGKNIKLFMKQIVVFDRLVSDMFLNAL